MASSSAGTSKIRFVCVSDTHNQTPKLPKGDVLIHAGDLTNQGSYSELKKVAAWLEKTDFAVKIIVAGNHDLSLDPEFCAKSGHSCAEGSRCYEDCRKLIESIPGVVYLEHSSADIRLPSRDDISLRVFGSPHSSGFSAQYWAFQYSKEQAEAIWHDIPKDVDVLITHTPPAGYCDTSLYWDKGGCPALKQAVGRVKPALHVFGHCHEGRGAQIIRWGSSSDEPESVKVWDDTSIDTKKQSLLDLSGMRSGEALNVGSETAVVNASIMAKSFNRGPKEINKPIVVDIRFPIG